MREVPGTLAFYLNRYQMQRIGTDFKNGTRATLIWRINADSNS